MAYGQTGSGKSYSMTGGTGDDAGIIPRLCETMFQRIEESITVSTSTDLRNFDGELRVRFATDGVGYSHIDPDPSNPNGFVKTWAFTLEASPAGEIIDGTWDDNEDGHPDFAWVPYSNSVNPGRSENPYLEWTDLLRYLTDANNGTSPVRD